MIRMRAVVRGCASLAVLAVLVAGLPWTLIRWGHWPSSGASSGDWWSRLGDTVVSDRAILVVLTLAVAVVWAVFVVSLGVELVAALRGRQARRIVVAGPLQRGARGLVVAVLFAFSAPVAAAASTPARPTLTPAAATFAAQPASATPTARTRAGPLSLPRAAAAGIAGHTAVSAPSPAAVSKPAPATTVGAGTVVTVMAGDSAWELAATHLGDGMRWRELWDLNHGVPQPDGRAWVDPQLLMPGWQLQLPSPPAVVAPDAPSNTTVYVVAAGDTLSEIAGRLLGDPARYPEVFDLNRDRVQPDGDRLVDPNLIRPGWQLWLPGTSAEVPLATPTPTPAPANPSTNPPAPTPTQSPPAPSTLTRPAPSNATGPSSPRTSPPSLSRAPDTEPVVAPGSSSVPLVATLASVAVLAAGLAVRCIRLRRRRALRGTAHTGITASDVERAVLDTADVPLVRWAGQSLAQLLARLEPRGLSAGPLAVELSTETGIELLWDAPQHAVEPPGWQVANGGWAWRLAYDQDAPVPADTRCAAIPALITLGTRDGRHLLVDLEAFGVLAVSGPDERVDNWLRAVAWELGIGDDLSDAYIATTGLALASTGTTSGPSRLTDTTLDEVLATVRTARRAIGDALNEARLTDTFQARINDAPPLEATIGIVAAIDTDALRAVIDDVPPRSGTAVIVATDRAVAETAPAQVILDADGSGRLLPLDIPFHAAQLPLPAATTLDSTMNELADLDIEPRLSADSIETTAPVPSVEDVTTSAVTIAVDPPTSDVEPVADPAAHILPGDERADGELPADATSLISLEASPMPDDAPPTHANNGSRLGDDVVVGGRADPGPLFTDEDDEERGSDVLLVVRILGVPSVPDRPGLGRRELIFTVLLACRGELAASAVQDALWGAKPVEPKTVWNLIASARRALGVLPDGAPVVPTVDRAERLRLDPRVTTDLAIVASRLAEARAASSTQAIELLHQALGWVEGPPFDAPGYDWAHRDQDVAQASVLIEQTVDAVVALELERNEVDGARAAIARGLRGLPGNEALYRLRMQVEHHAGRHDGVVAAYDELSMHLAEFDAEPSGLTAALYHDLVGRSTRH